MNRKIFFIGVGNMGKPIAQNLIREGYHVTVYDKNTENATQLIDEGAHLATHLPEHFDSNCIVLTMLPHDEALIEVVEGQHGLAGLLGPNNIHISMSTISPETSQRMHDAHHIYGTQYISAPVLGRSDAAEAKKLWIFISGKETSKQLVIPILNRLSQKIYDFGEDVTSANVIKLAINFLILSSIEAMGESFTFIEKCGLNKEYFADMLCQTLFACPAYQYHAQNIANRKFSPAGFRLSLGKKDISLLLKAANSVNSPMPIASLLNDKLSTSLAKNRAQLDWSAITLNAAEEAGLTI